MKQLFFPALAVSFLLLLPACGNEEKTDDTAYDSVNGGKEAAARLQELSSVSIDYKARHAYAIVSPEGDKMWIVQSYKDRALASFEAEAISDDQWNIRFKNDERRTVMVTWVENASAFASIYPLLVDGLHTTFDSARCTTVPRDTVCTDMDYISVQRINTEYRTCKEIKSPNECHGIWTKVGYERHYGGAGCKGRRIQDVDWHDWVCAW